MGSTAARAGSTAELATKRNADNKQDASWPRRVRTTSVPSLKLTQFLLPTGRPHARRARTWPAMWPYEPLHPAFGQLTSPVPRSCGRWSRPHGRRSRCESHCQPSAVDRTGLIICQDKKGLIVYIKSAIVSSSAKIRLNVISATVGRAVASLGDSPQRPSGTARWGATPGKRARGGARRAPYVWRAIGALSRPSPDPARTVPIERAMDAGRPSTPDHRE